MPIPFCIWACRQFTSPVIPAPITFFTTATHGRTRQSRRTSAELRTPKTQSHVSGRQLCQNGPTASLGSTNHHCPQFLQNVLPKLQSHMPCWQQLALTFNSPNFCHRRRAFPPSSRMPSIPRWRVCHPPLLPPDMSSFSTAFCRL